MKQDKWTQQLREQLDGHEMAAPEGLWNDIEAAISQQPAANSRSRIVALRRWAVAASLLLLLASGGFWWLSSHDAAEQSHVAPEQTAVLANHTATEQLASPQAEQPEQPRTEQNTVAPSAPQGQPLPQKRTLIALNNSTAAGQQVQHEEATGEFPAYQTDATDHGNTGEQDAVVAQPKLTAAPTDNKPALTDHADRSNRPVNVMLYAMNSMGDYHSANAVQMDPRLVSNYNQMSYAANDYRNTRSAPVYLAGYEERQHHHQPVSFGLSVSYPLSQRLAVYTGVAYTRLSTDFVKVMRQQQLQQQQTLHYVGIPVGLSYRLWTRHGLTLYAAAGGQADFNVKARLETEGVTTPADKDRLQWSASGMLGVQYDVVPQLGVYAEPGLKYYFDNGSRVENFFKDKPASFSLQVGLRVNLQAK